MHAAKKCRQDEENELKHDEIRRLRQLNSNLYTQTKAEYYRRKLNEWGNDYSKVFGQMNILLKKNKNSNILPYGNLPLQLANVFREFFIDKMDKIMGGF